MKDWVYPNEGRLRAIALAISLVFWVLLIVGTLGIGLLYLLAAYVFYLFAQSAFISHIRGHAVLVGSTQMPDLHARVERCRKLLQCDSVPDVYLLHGNGVFNAFATRFLGRNFLVLLSDVVDALDERPDSIDFYIGHELGHIRQKHLSWGVILAPALFLPWLGAAYSRAREYTCDRHGLACCADPEDALRGVAALAAGRERWRTMEMADYAAQSRMSGGFWMSFHELVGDYPWLTKRVAWLRSLIEQGKPDLPRRSGWAWVLALFVPRIPGAGGSGFLVVVAMIGILAAVAVPAYQDYTQRSVLTAALQQAVPYEQAVLAYAQKNNRWPASSAEAGMKPAGPSGRVQSIDIGQQGVVRVELSGKPLQGGALVLEPYVENQRLNWRCHGEGLAQKWLPLSCRSRQ